MSEGSRSIILMFCILWLAMIVSYYVTMSKSRAITINNITTEKK